MNTPIAHLVWLGAGTATEPAGLLDNANQVTLFEARESACHALAQRYPQAQIQPHLLALEAGPATFREYTLPEYSALSPISGLKTLFPGIQTQREEPRTSMALASALAELTLGDNNNTLVIDLPDLSLALLQSIIPHLHRFNQIHLSSGLQPLYKNAATSTELSAFLQTQGYLLHPTPQRDPELPWLHFSLNPLWAELNTSQQELATARQEAERAKTEYKQQLDTANAQASASKQELQKQESRINELGIALTAANKTKQDAEQQLAATKQQLTTAQQELTNSKQQLTTAQQELAASKQSAEQIKTEHKQQLDAANKAKQDAEQQLAATKQQLTTAQQELATGKQSAEQIKTEHKQQLDAATKAKQDAEQQLTATKQQLTTAQQELAASKQSAEQIKTEHKQQLDVATKAKQDAEQQLATAKAEKEAVLKQQKENVAKFSSDAQIDEVISDLSAFFSGKFITYVDVGAFTGEILEKIVASKKISVREAHLYEPNPESFKTLKEKFSETKIKSFHANNFAVGDSEKQVTLLPAQSMTKIISPGDLSDSRQDVFVSDVKSLDTEINKITERHIHLLKIDVEGYEMEVLRGAEQLLKNQLADVIYIEVGFNKNGTQQTYMADIDNYLQDNGYRVFKIYEQKNEWIEDSPLLRRCNFAYMSTSFAKANPFKLTMTIAELKRELKKLQAAT